MFQISNPSFKKKFNYDAYDVFANKSPCCAIYQVLTTLVSAWYSFLANHLACYHTGTRYQPGTILVLGNRYHTITRVTPWYQVHTGVPWYQVPGTRYQPGTILLVPGTRYHTGTRVSHFVPGTSMPFFIRQSILLVPGTSQMKPGCTRYPFQLEKYFFGSQHKFICITATCHNTMYLCYSTNIHKRNISEHKYTFVPTFITVIT